MKVHVFADSTSCVGVSNPDPSNKLATLEHGIVQHLTWAAREVQFIGHVLQGASTLDIKKHIQRYLKERNPESFDAGIMFMCVLNDIEWTKKPIQR